MQKHLFLGPVLTTLFLGGCDAYQNTTNPGNSYRLIFDGKEDRVIKVEAEIEVSGGALLVHPDEIWYLPGVLEESETWWQLITIETIEDMAGNSITLGEREGNRITLNEPGLKRVRIRYSVDISYVDENLPYGTPAAGRAFQEGYFTVAKPFFITGGNFSGARISVEKTKTLNFDAPWDIVEEGYWAKTYEDLFLSVLTAGDYEVVSDPSGKLDYRLIVFGMKPDGKIQLATTMETVSVYYLKTYPLSTESRYLQVVYPERYLGGEAYPSSSVSGIIPEKIAEGGWKITMAHELFHVWNPFLIPGAETEEMEWFKEGFTNYLSERALIETGEIVEENWQSHVRATYENYLENLSDSPDEITIGTSGVDKDEYGVLVYDGGRAIAAWLDQELRRVSGGETDLKSLVSQLITQAETEKTELDIKSFLAAVAVIDVSVAGDLEIYLMSKTPVPPAFVRGE